jgi:hypothetical protein
MKIKLKESKEKKFYKNHPISGVLSIDDKTYYDFKKNITVFKSGSLKPFSGYFIPYTFDGFLNPVLSMELFGGEKITVDLFGNKMRSILGKTIASKIKINDTHELIKDFFTIKINYEQFASLATEDITTKGLRSIYEDL